MTQTNGALKMERTITVSPFNRISGDLEMEATLEDNRVRDARASGVMFRGFENLLKGRDPMDALVFTCRTCGICGVSHSIAASKALRDAFGAEMPPNAYLARNIVQAAEIAMNHPTHFYVLFTLDLTDNKYADYPAYKELAKRFTSFEGSSYIKAIKMRKRILEILGLFGGKWPHTLALQPGGTTRPVNRSEIIRALGILEEFQEFATENLLGCSLELWLENKSLQDIQDWLGVADHENSDLGLFIRCALESGLDKLGKGPDRFLSYGGYDLPDGTTWLNGGYFDGHSQSFDPEKIAEDVKYSWFEEYGAGRHPATGRTEPNVDKLGAYSWVKSPRYDGNVVEVGPLARMMNDNDPLIVDIYRNLGANVFTRNLARMHEWIRLLRQMGVWLREIDPDHPFYIKPESPKEAKGMGLTEAARGTLGHWISIEDGRVKNYQVVTPTAWNFSPRDAGGNPGPVEQALIGTEVEDPENPIEIAHIIRSYDPCLFCAVHTLRVDRSIGSFGLMA